ncbi:hypothetical protein E0Z10_g6278 [Xylaria hypoxylon]|uniref:Uncharacterized protein n=1 Tax=Xylaria hypoxylon TaxID=37992 RepID=A0A4Z0YR80_9PEZI|nr:hypothetical protein E0Z10_g6278 [Xylaria hypoxylon]
MNMEIVKRVRPSSIFNFAKASIGNLFLTGSRLFTGSLESAIYLLSTICAVPSTVATLPAINSNFTHHISAGLEDGSQITGQNAISHPSAPTSLPDTATVMPEAPSPSPFTPSSTSSTSTPTPIITTTSATLLLNPLREDAQNVLRETEAHDRIEDATLPGSLPSLRKPYLTFSKSASSPNTNDLPTRISRIWYINPYGHEIYPLSNPKVVAAISHSISIIYSIGSLYTSLIPSLILRGVGQAISSLSSPAQQKILILNSTLDRETGPSSNPLTATDFVRAIARACAESQGHFNTLHSNKNRIDLGVEVAGIDPNEDVNEVRKYVTHVLYLEGEGVPKVNKTELAALGVECVRVYGRRVDGMLRYDEAGLVGALEAVVGKAEVIRSRRNTSRQ